MIRPATLEDTESLIPLMKDLGYPTKREHLYKRLEKLLSHRDYHLWLYVRKDSSPIGFVGFIHQLAFEKNESYVRIAAMAVNASERGKGIGSKLLQAVEDWAIKHDISTIVLNSGNRQERQIAHRFYEAAGFLPKATGFYKQL